VRKHIQKLSAKILSVTRLESRREHYHSYRYNFNRQLPIFGIVDLKGYSRVSGSANPGCHNFVRFEVIRNGNDN